jgi:glycosyltransferase 2 family protein
LRHFGFPGSASAIIGYGVYHMLGGIVFAMLFFMLSDNSKTFDLSFIFFLISAYVASWFIGFITPGAPAGLGVKEAVLLGLLNNVVPDEAVLAAAVLLSRGMNILSDLLYFLVLHGLNLRSLRALSSREMK